MLKKCLPFAAVAVALFAPGAVHAQNMDMSHMIKAQVDFNRNFDAMIWQQSLEMARLMRVTGQPNPFNAQTLTQSNRANQQAFDRYLRGSQINSNRTSNAINNWTTGAVRGQGVYVNPTTGATYLLPHQHNVYHINPYGQYVPGYSPYGRNVYPRP